MHAWPQVNGTPIGQKTAPAAPAPVDAGLKTGFLGKEKVWITIVHCGGDAGPHIKPVMSVLCVLQDVKPAKVANSAAAVK